jgi:plasmid stabilization system protein ParE
MARRIIWSPHAARSLEDICNYIERDSRRYAAIFAQRIIDTIELAAEFPEAGRVVPEYNNPILREKILGDYRIVYRISDAAIEIVIVTHGTRLLKL